MKKTEHNDVKSDIKTTENLMQGIRVKMALNQRKHYLGKLGVDLDSNHALSDLFPNTLFSNGYRSLPNDIARSSLFTARDPKSPREHFQQKILFHLSDQVKIRYTGTELCARDDELIWLQLVHYVSKAPSEDIIEFKLRKLILDIGWPTTGQSYAKVRESLSRLVANEVYIENSSSYGASGGFSLIKSYVGINEDTSRKPTRYLVSIDRTLIVLFAGNTFSNIPWDRYKKLTPMARRLADYALSHKLPRPLSIRKFLEMCASDQVNSQPTVQRKSVRRICNNLVKSNLVAEAYIMDDKIFINR